jgi:hypothetical protein
MTPRNRHRLITPLAAVALAGALLFAGLPTTALAAAAPTPTPSSSPTGSPPPVGDARKATFGVQPATKGKPDGRPTLAYGATPGATLTDSVAFINSSLRTYTFEVYATDAVNDDAGDLTLLPADEKPTDAGSWITLGGRGASGRVTVKPRSYVVVPVDVEVPAIATPGDHVAGVVADLTTVSKGRGPNVQLHQRVGVRAFIRVAGEVQPGLAVEKLSADYHDNWNPVGTGSVTVTYRVRNVGNVNLGAKQTVTVDGLLGQSVTAHPANLPLLLPGSSVDVTVQMPGVFPELRGTARVRLGPLVPEGNVDEGVHEYSASTDFWAIPWVLIGSVVGLLVAGVFVWRWWRERRRVTGRHSVRAVAA